MQPVIHQLEFQEIQYNRDLLPVPAFSKNSDESVTFKITSVFHN